MSEERDILEYFTCSSGTPEGGFNLWTNGCDPEIRRAIINHFTELTPLNNKQAQYALKPFKNKFPKDKNGMSFSLNREQVSIIKAYLSHHYIVVGFEELKKDIDPSFLNELKHMGYKIVKVGNEQN